MIAILKHDIAAKLGAIQSSDEDAELFGGMEMKKRIATETLFRVTYFTNYLDSLKSALAKNELLHTSLKYDRLVDVFLLGTASERITGMYMLLLSKILTPKELS